MELVSDLLEGEEFRRGKKQLLETIVETVESLIIILDPDGRILFFNRAAEEVTGYDREEVLDQKVWDVFIVSEEEEPVREVFEELRTGAGSNVHENDWLTKDGERRCITWSNNTVEDDDGAVKYVIATGLDVTEKRRREDLSKHQERLAAVGELAAGVAHELGNPLSSLAAANRRLLQNAEGDDGETSQRLTLIDRAICRMQNIIERLMRFARREDEEWHRCSLNNCVREVSNLIEYDPRSKKVDLRQDLAEDLPRTYAEKDQLTQVFVNLAINALDALEQEDPPDRILTFETFVSETHEQTWVGASVQDSGPGIDEEVLPRLFDMFFTTKGAENGSGIGLHVCKQIVNEHDGEIDVETQPGEGTRFRVFIPNRDVPPDGA